MDYLSGCALSEALQLTTIPPLLPRDAIAMALVPVFGRAAFLVWLDQKFNNVSITSEQVRLLDLVYVLIPSGAFLGVR